MKTIDRKRVFASIAISLILIGTILVIHVSLPLVLNPEQNVNYNEFHSTPITRSFSIDYGSSAGVSGNTDIGNGNVNVTITFEQSNVFVGDYVDYVARASIIPPYVDINGSVIREQTSDISIIILAVDPQEDANKKYDPPTVVDEIRNQSPNALILYPQNLTAYRVSAMPFFSEGEKILHVFVLHAGGLSMEDKVDTEPIFRVQSSTERLQDETNILQTMADNQIIGLSEMAIFLAFILIGCDILFRIYLDPYTDDMKKG